MDARGTRTTAVPSEKVSDSPWKTPVSDLDVLKAIQRLSKSAKEPFSGSEDTTHVFSQTMEGFVIANDGIEQLTFTISDETYTVYKGEVFEEYFQPFDTVTVNTTVPFRAYGKG